MKTMDKNEHISFELEWGYSSPREAENRSSHKTRMENLVLGEDLSAPAVVYWVKRVVEDYRAEFKRSRVELPFDPYHVENKESFLSTHGEHRWGSLNPRKWFTEGESPLSKGEVMELLCREHSHRERAYHARKAGIELSELASYTGQRVARIVEDLIRARFECSFGDNHELFNKVRGGSPWAPIENDIITLWCKCGAYEPRFVNRVTVLLDLICESPVCHLTSQWGTHYGEALQEAIDLLPKKVGYKEFMLFVQGLRNFWGVPRNFGETPAYVVSGNETPLKLFRRIVREGRFSWRYSACRRALEALGENPDDTGAIKKLFFASKKLDGKGFYSSLKGITPWVLAGYKRFPRRPEMRRAGAEVGVKCLKRIKPRFKTVISSLGLVGGQSADEHALQALLKGVSWLGAEVDRSRNIHDDFVNIRPVPPLDDNAIELIKSSIPRNSSTEARECHALAIKMVNAWESLVEAGADMTSDPRTLAEQGMLAMEYSMVKSPRFAMEASRWGLDEKAYSYWEELFINPPDRECIPAVRVEKEGYKMYRLGHDDPRGPFLGEYTLCCQHPEGAGESCVRHGMESPHGGFYVVEDRNGKIVLQSWVWRWDNVVVFDNIEGLRCDYGVAYDLYYEVSQRMLGRLGVDEVRVGTGGNDLPPIEEAGLPEAESRIDTPYGCWSDATDEQLVLAKKEGGNR